MRSVSPFSLSLVTYLVTFATSSPLSILSLQAVVLRRPSEVFIATPLYDRLRASTPSAHEHPIVRSHSPSSHAHPKTASPSLRPRIRRSLAHVLTLSEDAVIHHRLPEGSTSNKPTSYVFIRFYASSKKAVYTALFGLKPNFFLSTSRK